MNVKIEHFDIDAGALFEFEPINVTYAEFVSGVKKLKGKIKKKLAKSNFIKKVGQFFHEYKWHFLGLLVFGVLYYYSALPLMIYLIIV